MGNESEKTSLTITLTGRAPVRIRKEEWPILAETKLGSGGAYERDWTRSWRLVVRQHADGRALVYGIYDTRWQGERDRRGGELLEAGADIVEALRRVADGIGAGDDVVQACVADLPAEDLTRDPADASDEYLAVRDVAFDAAGDVTSIRYRLHPLDVGFDLREGEGHIVQIEDDESPLRVSYPDAQGERRVMEGPCALVIAALERLGFQFRVEVHGAKPDAIRK